MKLDYISKEPKFDSDEDNAVVQRVLQRRGDRGLIPVDRALLHSPPVTDGWNAFIGAIRTKTSLPASIREVAISRVAVLNKAWYEWIQHVPILRESGVLSETAIDYLLNGPPTHKGSTAEIPMDDKHATVLQYADASTVDIEIPDAVFEKMRSHFSEKEIVEITTTIGAYNCVSRFLVALNVGEMNGKPPAK